MNLWAAFLTIAPVYPSYYPQDPNDRESELSDLNPSLVRRAAVLTFGSQTALDWLSVLLSVLGLRTAVERAAGGDSVTR